MANTKTEPKFAELDERQLTFIERVKIGRVFVTNEQAQEIAKVLLLENKATDELRAIRNSVVKHLGDLISVSRTFENTSMQDHYSNNLSGIVTVIDSYIFA